MIFEPAQLRHFAARYTAAWCSQDAASVAAFYSPHGSLTINSGVPAVGTKAVTATAQAFMSAFPDLQVFLDDVVQQGNRAIYHWTLTGANTGPGGTGRAVRISGFEEWKFGEDGLIAESEGYFDITEWQNQLERGATKG